MTINDLVRCVPKSTIAKYNLKSSEEITNYIFSHLQTYKPDNLSLYHGSYNSNLVPKFGFGKEYNDYGLGFYTTFDIVKAKEWAHTKEVISGYVYEITIDLSDLSVFNFNTEPIYVWLAELIKHRIDLIENKNKNDLLTFVQKYGKDIKDDIVYGWWSDSSFHTIIDAFINGDISYEMIDKYLSLSNKGYQIFLKSQKAFNSIISVKNLGTVEHSYFDKYRTSIANAIDKLHEMLSQEPTIAKATTFDSMVRDAYL